MAANSQEVWLIRHGQTEWSRIGRHTGRTDLPLTEEGRRAARLLRSALAAERFAEVFTSPLRRARETCELAGLGDRAGIEPDLSEWNYGEYEGLTHEEIEKRAPGWILFEHGCPGGESPEQIRARLDRLVGRIRAIAGNVALFAHGHILRALAARWLGLPVLAGGHFFLDTATLSTLGYYRESPAVKRWNSPLSPAGPNGDDVATRLEG
jgi:broad specificity phosphatase PhoE